MAYKEGVFGGCISLVIGGFMAWTGYDLGNSELQLILYAIGGLLILFGIFGIVISLKSQEKINIDL